MSRSLSTDRAVTADPDVGAGAGDDGVDDGSDDEVDGRTARRDRNRLAVLDAVLELFSEDNLAPTPEEVARRSGVSLRSVYRYVADRDDLIRAAIERNQAHVRPLFALASIGVGPRGPRIDAFVRARLRGYEAAAATARAARLQAPANRLIRDQLDAARRDLRAQLEQQFEPELRILPPSQRRAVTAAADALTQFETLDYYRRHRGCSLADTQRLLAGALDVLLLGGRTAGPTGGADR